ncbi:LETM1-like protein-domain-containing protein [Chytriomyces cf. hyalinus JEL632]|nr:LETM1-like protein-domain-containing protein [Chytriomyces cf. hyalinus JEL632]
MHPMFSRLALRPRPSAVNYTASVRSLCTPTTVPKHRSRLHPIIAASSIRHGTSPLRSFSTPATQSASGTSPAVTIPAPATKPETPVEKVIREVKEEQRKVADSIPPISDKDALGTDTLSPAQPAPTPFSATAGATAAAAASVRGAVRAEKAATATKTTQQTNHSATGTTPPTILVEPKKPLMQRIKDEAHHLYLGMKLLATETSISSRLLVKLMKGNMLTRREGLQLRRTVADLLRLVPMLIILLIPFLELALPLLLYIFPNMLPSTFESKYQAEEKKKRLLKVRLEMAKFLQETVAEVSVTGTARAQKAKEFSDFFQKYRTTGLLAPTDQVLAIAKKFQDDLTLNSLSRPQLISMARYMNLSTFGTDAYLRNQINDQLVSLKRDDMLIAKEGVDNLTVPELQTACNNRGIKVVGVSPARLKSELMQWLDLHLTHGVPGGLLILSRAFTISEKIPTSSDEALKESAEALQQTLSALPQQVLHEAQLQVAETAGTATRSQKLNVIQEQEELIEDELEQDEEIAAGKAAEHSPGSSQAAASSGTTESSIEKIEKHAASFEPSTTEPGLLAPVAPTATSSSVADAHEKLKAQETDSTPVDLSKEELKRMGDVMKVMVSESALNDMKAELKGLKEETKEYREDIDELKQLTQKEPPRTVSAVSSRVNKMIASIESEISKIDSENNSKNNIHPDASGNLSVEQLQNALNLIKGNPRDERINKIVKRLDRDGDGIVTIPEVLAFVSEVEMQAAAAGEGRSKDAAADAEKGTPASVKSSGGASGPQ